MTIDTDVGISPLPKNAILLVLGLGVAWFSYYFFGWSSPIFIVFAIVMLFLSVSWALNLRNWMKSDAATRSKMAFPKKTVSVLFWLTFVLGLFVVWIDRELSSFHWR